MIPHDTLPSLSGGTPTGARALNSNNPVWHTEAPSPCASAPHATCTLTLAAVRFLPKLQFHQLQMAGQGAHRRYAVSYMSFTSFACLSSSRRS